jgi:hypothetical protein
VGHRWLGAEGKISRSAVDMPQSFITVSLLLIEVTIITVKPPRPSQGCRVAMQFAFDVIPSASESAEKSESSCFDRSQFSLAPFSSLLGLLVNILAT